MSTVAERNGSQVSEELFPPGFLSSVEDRAEGERGREVARHGRSQQQVRARWLVLAREFPSDFVESVEPYPDDRWQHRARRARWAEIVTKILGLVATGAITFASVEDRVYSAIAATAAMLAFLGLTALIEFGLACLQRATFVRCFWRMYVPAAGVAIIVATALAIERMATGDLALSLARIEGVLIGLLEVTLLVAGGIASVGHVIWGTPDRLNRESQANDQALRQLGHTAERAGKSAEVSR